MSLTLKFSNDYEKLPIGWEDTEARLISVDPVDLERLPPDFIRYDTKYRDSPGRYPLPKQGKYMVLWFLHKNTGKVFSTIRRFTMRKYAYYTGSLYALFLLVRIEIG